MFLSDMDYEVPREEAEPEAEQAKAAKPPAAPIVRPVATATEQPPAGKKAETEAPKQKAVAPARIGDQPRPLAPPRYRPMVLTVKDPPAGGKLARVAFPEWCYWCWVGPESKLELVSNSTHPGVPLWNW